MSNDECLMNDEGRMTKAQAPRRSTLACFVRPALAFVIRASSYCHSVPCWPGFDIRHSSWPWPAGGSSLGSLLAARGGVGRRFRGRTGSKAARQELVAMTAEKLEVFDTAARNQMIHAIALILVGLAMRAGGSVDLHADCRRRVSAGHRAVLRMAVCQRAVGQCRPAVIGADRRIVVRRRLGRAGGRRVALAG